VHRRHESFFFYESLVGFHELVPTNSVFFLPSRWGGEAPGAAGGGGGAQYAYPVLAAAPRQMSATVSQCAVALRRTAAGPHGRCSTCPAHTARRCSPAPRAYPVCACALRARRSMPASARAALVRAPVLCVGCARAVCRRPATVGPDRARRHRIVRHPLVNVVDIAGVRRPVLYAGAVHACVVALATPMLALRAPAMYALAVHAFVFARLRFPCSRCVLLLCVPLLCVPAHCAFVWCVVCLCSARLHRAALVDVTDTTPFVDPGDLTPFRRPDTCLSHPQSHRIALACPHAECYCTCLSCRNVVCLPYVLLYLLVLSCLSSPPVLRHNLPS